MAEIYFFIDRKISRPVACPHPEVAPSESLSLKKIFASSKIFWSDYHSTGHRDDRFGDDNDGFIHRKNFDRFFFEPANGVAERKNFSDLSNTTTMLAGFGMRIESDPSKDPRPQKRPWIF